MKTAIVVGHSSERPGARAVDGIAEWHWQSILAEQLTQRLPDSQVFLRSGGHYTRAMRALVRQINSYAPDLVLSLHFNAFDEPAGMAPLNGTMALHWPSSSHGQYWATRLSRAVSEAQRTRNLGPRPQARSWAGQLLFILADTVAPAVILETHYGDHADDHRKATWARDSGTTAAAIEAVLL